MPPSRMEELDDSECRKLLAARHFGRLAIPDFGGPVIFPVNYVFDQDLVVFRTDPGTKLDAATERESVAFEVDAVDEATRTGWSVVIHGTLAEITEPAHLARLRALPCTPGPLVRRPDTCACGRSRSPAAVSGSLTNCPSAGGADWAAPGHGGPVMTTAAPAGPGGPPPSPGGRVRADLPGRRWSDATPGQAEDHRRRDWSSGSKPSRFSTRTTPSTPVTTRTRTGMRLRRWHAPSNSPTPSRTLTWIRSGARVAPMSAGPEYWLLWVPPGSRRCPLAWPLEAAY